MIAAALSLALLLPFLQRQAPRPSDTEVRAAEKKALVFLLAHQEADGAFGSARNASFNDLWENPETHKAWTVGTTGLAVMALLGEGPGAEPALRRGVDALVAKCDLKRVSEWDMDDVWGYIYGLQALARVLEDPRFAGAGTRAAIERAARTYADKLARCRAGGWSYYANANAAWRPEWSTSFTTAVAVLALVEAKRAGIEVADGLLEPGLRAIERCRLPTGAFTYNVEAIPGPGRMEGIDNVKGAIGRIQVCNLALLRGGREVGVDRRVAGLEQFFESHRFLEIGRRRPIPHEAYYQVAGYFYYFGHYYAAEVIASLPREKREPYASQLLRIVIDTQEADGSMTDYVMHDYPRPYGTAYGLLVMQIALAART
ncbi:MAG TPA: hypothetical protein VGR31_06570 [Planctomycetota bacterium]|nr:hypothetical protein [Planctomycetota bacterium]